MMWALLIVLAVVVVLAVMVGALLVRVRRLEARLGAVSPSSDSIDSSFAPHDLPPRSLDGAGRAHLQPTEYVITRIGEPDAEAGSDAEEQASEPAPTVSAPLFADIVLKETVVQTASLFHGLRRALAPETRNRIRFHMRQEVKRSRKQRRAELREMRREWAARQRAAMAAQDGAEGAEGSAA